MRYLLDTCVISEPIRKRPCEAVLAWLKGQDECDLFLSVLTFGELEKGIAKLGDHNRRETLRDWVDHDLRRRFDGRILPIDGEVASRWGVLAGEADRRGAPLPVLDGLLIASALTHGLYLVTRNVADMRVPGVPIVNPWND